MLKKILYVPVIMICATGGTIGLIKLIQKGFPNMKLPDDFTTKTWGEKK